MTLWSSFTSSFCLLLLVAFAAASVIPHDSIFNDPLLARQDDWDDPQCISACDLDHCSGAFCGVSFTSGTTGSRIAARFQWDDLEAPFGHENVSSSEFTLAKRVDELKWSDDDKKYPGDIDVFDEYLPAVFQGNAGTRYGRPLPVVYERNGQADERAHSQMKKLEGKPLQIMAGGLHGCTMVTLVSRRAVWMAHYWQSYSNGPAEDEHGNAPKDDATDPAFVERVIRHFQGRANEVPNPPADNGYKHYIAPTSPGIDPSLFDREDDETMLFIMAPLNEKRTKLLFEKRVEKMRDELRKVLPRGRRPKYTIYKYPPLNYRMTPNGPEGPDAHLVGVIARGHALFQYDPDVNGKKGWRLMYEGTYYQHTW